MLLRLYSIVVFTVASVASKRGVEEGCWPYNVIPYNIVGEFSEEQKQWIRQQIREVHRLTCVRWVDISENNLNVTDYALFVKTEDMICTEVGQTTDVGFVALISLSDLCFRLPNGVIHEMMHVMGFDHEHQRPDRDCYVDIDQWTVITARKKFQYKVLPSLEWMEKFPYDKRSVMHYPRDNRMKARSERWYEYEPLGNTDGKLTDFDQWKIRYRFCNEPHYCDVYPLLCKSIDQLEKGCRKNSSDIATASTNSYYL